MIPYKTVNKLFIKLEKIYKDLHYKEHVIEKFGELKMSLKSFNVFYLKCIKLVIKLKFTKMILLQEYMHKLFLYIQDRINSELKYPDYIRI